MSFVDAEQQGTCYEQALCATGGRIGVTELYMPSCSGSNLASIQLSHSFALELALALSVKRYTFPNDYNRSRKVNTTVELPVQETFQL